MLDLVRCFEVVQHHELIRSAHRNQYSLHLLRVALAAYRLKRTVGYDGLFSSFVVATCGITAGSGFACTELRVLLVDVMDELIKGNPWNVERLGPGALRG